VRDTGQPLRLDDVEPGDADGARAYLGVPLDVYGQVDGVLALHAKASEAFTAHDERLLRALAAQVAVALENARLYELAMVDGLTGLFVRRYFDARLAEEVERSRRFGTEFSVVMFDLDDFKRLNDRHGHPVGDRVLRAAADVIRRQMRGVDTAARYGGEEFAIILPRTGLLDAHKQAERVRKELEELSVPTDAGPIGITASLGIAAFPASGAADGGDLVVRADTALYRAKRTGKNRVELYWPEGQGGERPPLKVAERVG
jgi:diguanylate cyclase (GGDEF)-like protein